jgi:hypothetical protein
MTNWVERRWQREQQLETQAPELWNQVRGAIQDACASFKQRYRDGPTVECTLENGTRIRIVVKRGRQMSEAVVSYDNDLRFIDVAGAGHKKRYVIDVGDEGTHIKHVGMHFVVTPDALSDQVLRPLLFGEDAE